MAKPFGGLGGRAAAAPMMTNNGSPGGVRPMPRPAGLGGVEVEAAPKPAGGFLAQQFGPQGSDARYEMAMQMLQSAMSGAAGSNSPALAFLAPIIGSVTSAKLAGQREQYVGSEAQKMTEGLLGGQLNPQAQQALDVLNNPNAPDYLKQIASTMFKQNAVPFGQTAPSGKRSSGGSRRSSGGGASSRPQKLTYISRDPDGVVRGYNAATGKREVVENADAAPAAAQPVAPALPPPPTDPVLPRDPVLSADDDLINKYLD